MEDNSKPTQPLLTPPAYAPPTPAGYPYPPQGPQQGYPPQGPQGYPQQVYAPQGYGYQYQPQQPQHTVIPVVYPSGAALLAQTCSFHPQFAAVNRCYSCSLALCLDCTHHVRTSRWGSQFTYCHDCARRVRRFRLFFFILTLLIFFAVFGIVIYST